MAQANYTPIQLYYSTTAAAVPTAANLAQGELAINITDGKLYYEDNGGTVQVIATKGTGTIGGSTTQIQYNNAGALAGNAAMVFNNSTSVVTLTTLNLTNALGAIYGGTGQSTYTTGDLLYSSATNTLSKLAIGTANYILTVNSGGTNVQWSAPSSISVSTATNLAGGVAGSVPYQSGASTTTFLGIGAADRVMTSSGTAPQWVTALTGLTGVSSSSITNTGLTSGRVVFSGASGLESDSANLTFNGTTLSAGGFSTTGLSTLVQTVKIGDSNFNGVAVFAPATPAKLYMGTGTVTDVTSAVSATNTTGAIASLAITPIAATNTGVTYTNAATLYIAGAPSAGTNISITNPYALYIAAGNVYLGGGTVNGVAYLDTNKVLTTGSALVFDGTNLGLSISQNAATKATLTNSNAGVSASARYEANNGSNTAEFGIRGSAQTTNGVLAPQVGYMYSPSSAGLALVGAAGPILFSAGGTTESMRIDSSGNVGIGTSSPSASFKLDVAGKIRVAPSSGNAELSIRSPSGSSNYITFAEASVADRAAIGFANGSGNLQFRMGGYDMSTGTQSMTLDSSGNLGLGVTPNTTNLGGTYSLLAVGKASGSGIIMGQTDLTAADSTAAQFLGKTTGASGYQLLGGMLVQTDGSSTTNAVGRLTFYTATGGSLSERARIDSSGNLLVGTTAATGLASNTVRVVGGILNTASASGLSFANNTATTIFTLSDYQGSQSWIVSADVAGQSNASAYACVYLVVANYTGAASVTALRQGSLSSISVSGLDVKYTQASGGTQTSVQWSAIRIM